jgi:hypothetical protein
MTDPYLTGFYVGLATATVMELLLLLGVAALIRAKRMRPRALRHCQRCDAEVLEDGGSRDSLFTLYVCQECGDTVPKRFATDYHVPLRDMWDVTHQSQDYVSDTSPA